MKLTWDKLDKKDIIFLENNYANISFNKKIKVYNLNKNEINLRYFLNAFFNYLLNLKKNTLKENYLLEIFKKCKPKIIIGYAHNFLLFKIKKIYPNIKSIMYMHYAMRKDQFDEYKKIVKKAEIDNIFLNNPIEKKFLQKFIKSEFILSGSIKNNETMDKKKKKPDYDVMIISEYRNNLNLKKKDKIVNSLTKISNLCENNSLNICIALVSSREEKMKKISFEEEIQFYKKTGIKFNYSLEPSYKLANRSKVIFSIDSNLGYELIAKKHKVFFFHSKNNIYLKKYPFVTNVLNRNFDKLFLRLINLNTSQFSKILKSSKIKFYFDKKNKIFKNYIEKIIYKK